jgi:hypothetical protein
MFATQYRPNFITTDEPLDRDIPVEDWQDAQKLPWIKQWLDADDVREVGLEPYLDGVQIILAHTVSNEKWVVGYLSDAEMTCGGCSTWKLHCRCGRE